MRHAAAHLHAACGTMCLDNSNLSLSQISTMALTFNVQNARRFERGRHSIPDPSLPRPSYCRPPPLTVCLARAARRWTTILIISGGLLYDLCTPYQVDYRVGNTDALSALVALACRARRDAVRVGAVRCLKAAALLTMAVLTVHTPAAVLLLRVWPYCIY